MHEFPFIFFSSLLLLPSSFCSHCHTLSSSMKYICIYGIWDAPIQHRCLTHYIGANATYASYTMYSVIIKSCVRFGKCQFVSNLNVFNVLAMLRHRLGHRHTSTLRQSQTVNGNESQVIRDSIRQISLVRSIIHPVIFVVCWRISFRTQSSATYSARKTFDI